MQHLDQHFARPVTHVEGGADHGHPAALGIDGEGPLGRRGDLEERLALAEHYFAARAIEMHGQRAARVERNP
ncbi:hypothetical protein G6F31_021730 [Rhizopus arrhizus]|nr:hypothetical protein G6F31_021730 [Rhizopus arrhizus]